MAGAIGVCMRVAPSQHEAAPTTAALIGRTSIRASVQQKQPWETKRRRELASGSASGEGGGAATDQLCYHNNVLHACIYAMVIYLHGWYQGVIDLRESYPEEEAEEGAALLDQ